MWPACASPGVGIVHLLGAPRVVARGQVEEAPPLEGRAAVVVAVVAAAELDAEDGRVELLVEDERRAGGRGDRLGDVRLGLAVQLHRLRGRGPDRVDGRVVVVAVLEALELDDVELHGRVGVTTICYKTLS